MKYIIFGTGEYYKRYISWFKGRDVVALLDNATDKQGTLLGGVPVISPTELHLVEYDVIIILSFYVREMKQQLLDLGVEDDRIFHFYDLHDLFARDDSIKAAISGKKRLLLLTHDLEMGGPALALFHAARVLKNNGFEVFVASMQEGPLSDDILNENIPVIVDRRLQICRMTELNWVFGFDLIICNTINFNVFLSERKSEIPVIWWLHDARRYYDGIKIGRMNKMDTRNMKIVSVGPIPREAILEFIPGIQVDSLLYGVTENV